MRQLPVRVGQIETHVLVRPAEHVEMRDLIEEMRDLHNPILRVGDREITAIHRLDSFVFDHSEAASGELVWACDFCSLYSKTKFVTEQHERECPERN